MLVLLGLSLPGEGQGAGNNDLAEILKKQRAEV